MLSSGLMGRLTDYALRVAGKMTAGEIEPDSWIFGIWEVEAVRVDGWALVLIAYHGEQLWSAQVEETEWDEAVAYMRRFV